MEEQALVNHMGLLLTQMRFARRALEDVERATASYGGFAFTSALSAGPRFGEPPLFEGALKVHVINIDDLAPGSGFGALLEGLLGGVGRFIGGLFGGAIGGTISGVALPFQIGTLNTIAGRVESILRMIGLGDAMTAPAAEPRGETGGGTLLSTLDDINRAVDGLTGLFVAASAGPEAAAERTDVARTSSGEAWMRMLGQVRAVLDAVDRVARGLIILLPMLTGFIASFVSRLSDLRVEIARTLQFVLRNALMVRGTVTVVLFDMLAVVARTAASLIGTLATMIGEVVAIAFDALREALVAVVHLFAELARGVQHAVTEVVSWLVQTLDAALRNLGNLRVFRVLTHVIRILPAIMPPLFEIIREQPLPPQYQTPLTEAAQLPFLDVTGGGAGAAGPPPTPPPVPDVAATIEGLRRPLTETIDRLGSVADSSIQELTRAGRGGLQDLGATLERAATEESRLSGGNLEQRLADVRARSTTLAEHLVVAEPSETDTRLEQIARSYESWLTAGGGLATILSEITTHFTSPEGRQGVPRALVEGEIDRPRATIQIDEVVIEVEGAPAPSEPRIDLDVPPSLGPGDFPLPPEGDEVERYARAMTDYTLRGGDPARLTDATA